jgi:hypothetical protein
MLIGVLALLPLLQMQCALEAKVTCVTCLEEQSSRHGKTPLLRLGYLIQSLPMTFI